MNAHRLAPGVFIPEAAIEFTFASASGPGGQNVNKRATKAILRVRVADIAISPDALSRLRALAGSYLVSDDELLIPAHEHRSQERNKAECLERLGELVRAAIPRPKVRRKTKPSRGAKERRIAEKKHRGGIKRGRSDSGD